MNQEELSKLTVVKLKELAKEKNLDIKGLKKQEIIDLLINGEQEEKVEKEVEKSEQTAVTSNNKEKQPTTECSGILEVNADGFGFIRSENYLTGKDDVYVSNSQIRRFRLKTGDLLKGIKREKIHNEKFDALIYVKEINGLSPEEARNRKPFEQLTPIFPNERILLDQSELSMRVVDLIAPIGKGQRGLIVSPPKAGKTTLLKQIALSIVKWNKDIHLIILLIDERPEEVTDIKETIVGENVEVVYSTFDEQPERHKRVSEMTIEHAKCLVEAGKDVVILLDSLTRLTRAYNLTCTTSGKVLSGGLDPTCLYMPKRFFGTARNTREAGSLSILATALVDTGSKMDDVIYEEFKGTGNSEIVLNRKLQEKRIFPAIDIAQSSTRQEQLLLNPQEQQAVNIIRRGLSGFNKDEAVDNLLTYFTATKNNEELVKAICVRNKI